jgi:hypothetical protein
MALYRHVRTAVGMTTNTCVAVLRKFVLGRDA